MKCRAPDCEPNGPVALQICTVDHSSFVGRIGVGRLFSGTIHKNEPALVIKNDGTRYNTTIKQVFTFEELGKKEQLEVHAGDIVAVVGVDDADIGDMVTSRETPVRLDPIEIEEPTMAVVFEASNSPLVGREGEIVGARQLKERLMREAESNISMRICRAGRQERHRSGRPWRAAPFRAHGNHASRRLRIPGGPAARHHQEGRGRPQAGAYRGSHRWTCRANTPGRPSRCSAAPAAR